MKKTLLILMATLLLFAGCGPKNEPGTIKDGKSLADVIAHVDTKFEEKYDVPAVATMAQPLDEQYLVDFYHLEAADVTEMAGSFSMIMVNSDTLVGVKAAEGKVDKVIEAFNQRKQDIINQFENYNVNGSYDRAVAGEVYQKGDYVFLIVVGHSGDNNAESPYDFPGDMAMTKAAIDEMFNA